MLPLITTKKGLETPWWVFLVFILAIAIFLIFFVFIRGGFSQIGTALEPIFGGLGK
jgi:hypothetical protein